MKITWLRVGALVINLLLVVYLVWSKRLFGVRGGKQAYEARLRTESVIEQAALAAAAPRDGVPRTTQCGLALCPQGAVARPPTPGAPVLLKYFCDW